MSEILARIRQHVPSTFFQEIAERSDAAFHAAYSIWSSASFEEPEQRAMLGHIRHAKLEAAIRASGAAAGMLVTAPHTDPKGGRYSVVQSGPVVLCRAKVACSAAVPCANKYRGEMAAINAYLSPQQLDLFEVTPIRDTGEIFGFILTVADEEKPSIPKFIGLGVPDFSMTGWLLLKSIGEVLASYQAEVPGPLDQAHPKLKKNLRRKGDRDTA